MTTLHVVCDDRYHISGKIFFKNIVDPRHVIEFNTLIKTSYVSYHNRDVSQNT